MAGAWGSAWGTSWAASWGAVPVPIIDIHDGGYGYREAREPDWQRRRAEREDLRRAIAKAFRKALGEDDAEEETAEIVAAPPVPVVVPAKAEVVDLVRAEIALHGLRASVADIEAALADYERQRADLIEEEAIVMLLLA